jgi:hypothetical protein
VSRPKPLDKQTLRYTFLCLYSKTFALLLVTTLGMRAFMLEGTEDLMKSFFMFHTTIQTILLKANMKLYYV